MIIWINGAFGSGKTQAAFELHRRLAGSFVYDPENIGYFLRKNQPPNMNLADFQDEPLWRSFNYEMLLNISKRYDGVIIVPMTIYKEQYFNEIIKPLRDNSIIVHHYVLGASKRVIMKRIGRRFENRNSWAASKINDCIRGFKNPVFENYIDTDYMSTKEVIEYIAKCSDIKISRGVLLRKLGSIVTQLRHVRWK